jgi:hypothetical protein
MNPKDALALAQRNFDLYTGKRKAIPGVTDTATRNIPPKSTIPAVKVPETITREVSRYPGRNYAGRLPRLRSNKILGATLPESPVNDELRATPGTLENAMAQIDQTGRLDPRDRETIKTMLARGGTVDAEALKYAKTLVAKGDVTEARAKNIEVSSRVETADKEIAQAKDWVAQFDAAFRRGAGMLAEGFRTGQVAPLAETQAQVMPNGLVNVDEKVFDKLAPDQRLNAKIALQTIKQADPSQAPAFINQIMSPGGEGQLKEGMAGLLDRFVAGDENAVAEVAAMGVSAAMGGITPGGFKPSVSGFRIPMPKLGKGAKAAAKAVEEIAGDAAKAVPAEVPSVTPEVRGKGAVADSGPVMMGEPVERAPGVPIRPQNNVPTKAPSGPDRISEPQTDALGGIKVADRTARSPRGEKVEVEWRVVEREKLRTSHNSDTYELNSDYPQELQKRDRSSRAEQLRIQEQARNLEPGQLLENFNSTDRGPSVVGLDGVVESGNGRVMTIDRARKDFPLSYAKYRRDLEAEFPEAANMQNPVLVQVRKGDPANMDERIKFADTSNEGSSGLLSEAERARADISSLPQGIGERIKIGPDFEESLNSRVNQQLVTEWVSNLPITERALVMDTGAKGLSQFGKERFANAITAFAMGGDDAMDLLGDVLNDGDFGKRAWTGLTKSMDKLVRLRERALLGDSIADEFRRAVLDGVEYYRQARDSGSISGWFAQGTMADLNPDGLKLAREFAAPDAASATQTIVSKVTDRLETADGGMFGDEMKTSVTELVDLALKELNDERKAKKAAAEKNTLPLTTDEPVAVSAPKVPQASSAPAPSSRPIASTAKLPRELQGAKPRYSFGEKQFDLDFQSDVDKAAYILAQGKRSKADAQYLAWAMDQTGMDEASIRAMGADVRAQIKEMARSAKGGTRLTVADSSTMPSAGGSRPGKGRAPRDAGAVDWRLLAGAGTLSVGAAIVATPAFREWWENSSMTQKGVSAGVAGAAVLALYGVRKAKGTPGSIARFSIDASVLDPLALARKYEASPERVSAAFGKVLDDLATAKAEHVYESSRAIGQLSEVASKQFGKNWLDNPEFKEWNVKLRDTMEANVASGKSWDDGLPPKVAQFVRDARPILDDLIDEWEAEGGRIQVKNENGEYLKLDEMKQSGDVELRLPSGQMVRYERTDITPADPNDPFSTQKEVIVALDDQGAEVEIDPGQSFGRPVYRLGEAFVPRQFKKEFMELVKGLAKNSNELKQAISQYYAGVPMDVLRKRYTNVQVDVATQIADMLVAQNSWAGLPGDEMISKLFDVANEIDAAGTGPNSFMANLERQRSWDLAKFTTPNGRVIDPYENSYIDAVTRYLDRGWQRVSVARQWGPNPEALGGVIKLIERQNVAYGRYLSKFAGQVMGIGADAPIETVARARARVEGAYQALTKLTGGTTVISQANDLVFATTEAGPLKLGSAMGELLKPDATDLKIEADALAGLRAQYQTDLAVDMPDLPVGGMLNQARRGFAKGAKQIKAGKVSEGLADFTGGVMALVGIRGADRAVKRVAAVTLLRDAQSLLAKFNKLTGSATPNAAAMAEVVTELKKYGLEGAAGMNPLDLPNDRRAMAKLGQHLRRTYTYSGSPEDFPLWMSTPGGAFITRFKKPIYMTTRYLMERVMSDLSKGDSATLVKFLGTSLAFGLGSTYLKDVIRLKGMDQEARDAAMKGDWGTFVGRLLGSPGQKTLAGVLADPQRRTVLSEVMYAAGQQLYDSGSLGFAGDLTPLNRQNTDITGAVYPSWRLTAPITAVEAEQVFKSLSQGYMKGEKIQKEIGDVDRPLANSIADQEFQASFLEQFSRSVIVARRAMDLLNLKTPLMQLKELERKKTRTIEEDSKMLQLKRDIFGTANTIKTVKEEMNPAPPTQTERVSEAIGISQSGTLK